MDPTASLSELIAISLGAAWASGLNLYAAILTLGLMGQTDYVNLPVALEILQNPWVLGAAGIMFAVEFLADKVPGFDTVWDGVHTFIRIPAGALLAAASVGEVSPGLVLAMGLVGGAVTTTSHGVKAGSRAMINTSPEPFSNWTASVSEDLSVIGGLWVALNYPWLFFGLLAVFVLFAAWVLPKIWRFLKVVFGRLMFWRREERE